MANDRGEWKRYLNSGVTRLYPDGVEINPGEEFEASLDPVYEAQMIAGGHLTLLGDAESQATDPDR